MTATITWYQDLLTAEVNAIRSVQAKIVHFPGKLRAARDKVSDLKQKVADTRHQLGQAEADIQADVLSDASLKNADQRKAAVTKALAENGVIRETQQALRQAEGQLAQAESELQEVADQWRALRICQEGSIAISRLAAAVHGPHDHPQSL